MPKEPKILLEGTFEGGILVSMEDVYAAIIAATLVGAAGALLPEDRDGQGAARRGRRPPGGAVDRHPAEPHLGDRLERGGAGGARWPA
jgi:branched-chain amino acid transport system permease protein